MCQPRSARICEWNVIDRESIVLVRRLRNGERDNIESSCGKVVVGDQKTIPLIEGAPARCCQCGAVLCLRKQVINLVFGNTEVMQCLQCLAAETGARADTVLTNAQEHVAGRECFRKEWQKYRKEDCPDPTGCIPDVCFCAGQE